MKCVLIFDTTNDVVYTKYDEKFALHINEHAKLQELIPNEYDGSKKIELDVLVQMFSPIVASQRIMACQFGNSYTSIQCDNDPNLAFEEYMGFLFLYISNEEVQIMKRFLSVCITLVRYLCGPDVNQLRNNPKLTSTLTDLINSWSNLYESDQGIFIEAVEQLMVNQEIGSAAVRIIKDASEKLKNVTDFAKIHTLLLVQNKFLSLYSSPSAQPLSSADILFATLLSNTYLKPLKQDHDNENEEDGNEIFINTHQVLLAGSEFTPKCIPYIIHIAPLSNGIHLICFLETGKINVASHLYDSFLNLHSLESVQIHRDIDTLKPAVEYLDGSIKKLIDNLKKVKGSNIEAKYKLLQTKWDFMKKNYVDFIKNQSKAEAIMKAESNTRILLEILKDLLQLTSRCEDILNTSQTSLIQISNNVKNELEMYKDFFVAKAMKNFSLGSRDSLTINKYLEEFPGLVHFLYVDRTNHRVTTPTLDFSSDETNNLTKRKIWEMINFGRNHLQEGHLSMMWKDTTFNYSYFLWFEDSSGSPLKPTIFPTNASKVLPQPGILCGDFYQKLREYCFPKMNPSKIRCYELFCIHLGLVTASCVLEHTRRLFFLLFLSFFSVFSTFSLMSSPRPLASFFFNFFANFFSNFWTSVCKVCIFVSDSDKLTTKVLRCSSSACCIFVTASTPFVLVKSMFNEATTFLSVSDDCADDLYIVFGSFKLIMCRGTGMNRKQLYRLNLCLYE